MPRQSDFLQSSVRAGSVIRNVEWSQHEKKVNIRAVSTGDRFPPDCEFAWSVYDKYYGEWYDVPGRKSEVNCDFDSSIGGELYCMITRNGDYVDSIIVDFDYLCIDRIKYIMHGGYSGIAPENTLPAFELARGAWGCEADAQVTKDGVWVIFHDDKLNHLTDGKGYVRDHTYEELQKLNIIVGTNIAEFHKLKIPRIEEYLRLVLKENMTPVIAIKDSKYTDKNFLDLVAIIKEYNCEDDVLVISFEEKLLKKIRKISPTIKMQAIVQWVDFVSRNRAKSIGNCGLDFNKTFFSSGQITSAHDDDLEVNLWTVNNRSKAIRIEQTGADYITSSWKLYNYSNVVNRSKDFDSDEEAIFDTVEDDDLEISNEEDFDIADKE